MSADTVGACQSVGMACCHQSLLHVDTIKEPGKVAAAACDQQRYCSKRLWERLQAWEVGLLDVLGPAGLCACITYAWQSCACEDRRGNFVLAR